LLEEEVWLLLPVDSCKKNNKVQMRQLLQLCSATCSSTWVLLPTTLTLLPLLPTLLPTLLLTRLNIEIALQNYCLCLQKFANVKSNFNHSIFKSGLSLLLSPAHMFRWSDVACFPRQMLCRSDASLVRCFARHDEKRMCKLLMYDLFYYCARGPLWEHVGPLWTPTCTGGGVS
jgi:hypothetical protein